jgi:hypothetical protein
MILEWILSKDVEGVRFGYTDKVEISSFIHIIMNLRVPQKIASCDESLRELTFEEELCST